MSAESVFLNEISKLKRLVFIRFVCRIGLWTFLILLGGCAIVFITEKAGLIKFSQYPVLFFISAGIILLAVFLFATAKRRNFLTILIDIDTRLKLQDRITTAYEYQRSGNKSVFSDLLMQDAASRLRQISDKQIWPAKNSFLHGVLILMIILNAALYSSDYFIAGFNPIPGDQDKIEKARTLVRNYSMSRSEGNQAKKAGRNDVYSRKWEHLKKTIDDRSLTRDQLFGTLNRFLKEIQGEQAQLTNELDAKLNAAGIDEMSIQNISDLKNLSASELEKQKMLLNRALNNRIPDSINRDIETMEKLYSMEKLLSQILDDFNEDKSNTDEFVESQRNETPASESAKNLENAKLNHKHSSTSGRALSTKPGSTDTAGRAGSDQSRGNDRDVQDDMGFAEGFSPTAGHAKSAGEQKPGHELEKSPGPGIQDKMNLSRAKNYLIQIRSVTAVGESNINAENILRAYRQEVESVLQKEDMPLNYREYIKQYFLSIGIKTADSSQIGAHGRQ